MRLIFVRHPQTEGNVKRLIYGRYDAQYSEEGRKSIPGIVEALRDVKFDALIASPLSRTRYLAEEIAADHGLTPEAVRYDDRILEMNFGVLEAMTTKEAKEKQKEVYDGLMADYEQYVIPEGESCVMVYERVGQFLEDIYAEFEGRPQKEELSTWEEWSGTVKESRVKAETRREKTIVVVAHSMVIHVALACLLKIALHEIWHIKIEPGSLVDLDWRCDFAMLQGLAGPFNIREIQ